MTNPAEYVLLMQKLCTRLVGVEKKLGQFRRHADWGAALAAVSNNRRDLFTKMDDGRWAIHEDNTNSLVDLADDLFFERIIAKESMGARR